MKVILVTKANERIQIDVDDSKYDRLGVIIRQDTRMNPPLRVFNYLSGRTFSWRDPPEFHESDAHFVDSSELTDEVQSLVK